MSMDELPDTIAPLVARTLPSKLQRAVRGVELKLQNHIDPLTGTRTQDEADVIELICVLGRILEGKTILEAFGAPGDWGYGTPIGDALNEEYQRPRSAEEVTYRRASYATTKPLGALRAMAPSIFASMLHHAMEKAPAPCWTAAMIENGRLSVEVNIPRRTPIDKEISTDRKEVLSP